MTSVIIDREIGDWNRFRNRRQIASAAGRKCRAVAADWPQAAVEEHEYSQQGHPAHAGPDIDLAPRLRRRDAGASGNPSLRAAKRGICRAVAGARLPTVLGGRPAGDRCRRVGAAAFLFAGFRQPRRIRRDLREPVTEWAVLRPASRPGAWRHRARLYPPQPGIPASPKP